MSRVGPDIMYALFTVFTITYGTQHLGLERNQVLVAILIGSAFQLIGIPLAGAISDRINRASCMASPRCAASSGR